MRYERRQVETLRRELAKPIRRIHAIFGPRQSGKTTIVLQALRNIDTAALYQTVEDPNPDSQGGFDARTSDTVPPGIRDQAWLVRVWEEARRQAATRGGGVLALDEIQKIDNWSETVKGLWDADRREDCPLHVVILGSAPMLMQSGLTESLAGRFQPIPVAHWSFPEMVDAFGLSLPEYAFYGGYPGASDLISEPPKWRRYVRSALIETTIERDVVGVARIEKPALLKQLFELGAAYSGQILAIEKILGLLAGAGNASTVVDYLHLLSRVGLLTAIPRYSRSPARQRTDRPKLLVLNTGLMTALSDYSFEEAQADRTFWGRIVETAAGAHLLNTADERTKVYYWRNKDGDEVDFVMTRGPRTVAIEVKTGKARTTRGMQLFKERFSPDRSVVVTSDEREPNSVSFGEYFARPASDWFEHGE